MSDTDLGQTESTIPTGNDATEPGFLHIAETPEETKQGGPEVVPAADVKPATPPSAMTTERAGTIEHLAARRPTPELNTDTPEVKKQLSELRSEVTRLLTGLRWEGVSVEETAEQLLPLLNVGPVQQWKATLIPFLFEIDRAGNLIPVWLKIIEKEDAFYLPPDANPAETPEGRARRFAILMLGNYKSSGKPDKKFVGFARRGTSTDTAAPDIVQELGKLSTNPNTSLYATQSLVKQGTTYSIQTLVSALPDVEGWARVDVVEGILALNQTNFYDMLVASGLDRAPGLESYIAVPIYRAIPLEKYLRDSNATSPRLTEQAALIVNQVLQDSMTPPSAGAKTLPIAFERDLLAVTTELFEGARNAPTWQQVVAIHRLGILLGRYWSDISRGAIQDPRIVNPIGATLPTMPEIERWIDGPGRDALLHVLNNTDSSEEDLTPVIKVLGELREPRATTMLITRLEATRTLTGRSHALALAAIGDALGRIGEQRAIAPIQQLGYRIVDISRRMTQDRRRDNLPAGDPDIPGSIVYAAVVRACGQLGDTNALDTIQQATRDFDPYVRTQALEALKRLDPAGTNAFSRVAVRDALADPRDSVVRAAIQIVILYRDLDAVPALRYIIETRSDLASTAYDALRSLGQ
ncbi:MAG TPA: HEAT repeat domain-containing protein [Ktedonosporobacter sp.]|nr:HEAT repeat domain-containing protein [Ktedonosporobacter sp.]